MVKSEKKFWAREFLILLIILIVFGAWLTVIETNNYLVLKKYPKYIEDNFDYQYVKEKYNRLLNEQSGNTLKYKAQIELLKNRKTELLKTCDFENVEFYNNNLKNYFSITLQVVYLGRASLYLLYHILKGLFKLTKDSIKTLLEKD